MESKVDMFSNLFKWIQTFDVVENITTPNDLNNGVTIAYILHFVCPEYFDDNWLSKIKVDTGSNWRLRVSNLKKIVKSLTDFYADVLDHQLLDKELPDINGICENSSISDLSCLLQLVLGCAVSCRNKELHIQTIMSMEETVQQSIMLAIKEVLERPRFENDIDAKLKKVSQECFTAVQAKDEMVQRCHELDYQVSVLQEEKAALQFEVERLTRRMEQMETNVKVDVSNSHRISQLEEQIDALQEELINTETIKEEYKNKAEHLEKEKDELLKLGGDLASLRDELDILRDREGEYKKMQTGYEQMKKRAEESVDSKRQVKLLEEQSSAQLKRTLELEEEVRRLANYRAQAEALREQGAESQRQLSEARRRADKAEFELTRVSEKVAMLEQESVRLRSDRDALREQCDEQELQMKLSGTTQEPLLQDDDPDFLSLPLNVKERLLRLERENSRLRGGLEEREAGELAASQALLFQAEQRLMCLETENREQSHQILGMNARLEDGGGEVVQELRRQVSEQLSARHQLDAELRRQTTYIEELESRVKAANERQREAADRLAKRDEDMKAMEERYKRHLDRAKNIIRVQMENSAASSAPASPLTNSHQEVSLLKSQLVEKERVIEQLERAQERSLRDRNCEDRLMVSAWYSLGMQLHQGVAGEFSTSSPGQSFLQRQRMAHLRNSTRSQVSGNSDK